MAIPRPLESPEANDIEFRRVQQAVGCESQVDAVESEADRVGQRSAKRVVLAAGHELAKAAAGVAECGNVSPDCASGSRFLPTVCLDDVVAVEPILLVELDVNVGGSLVERHIGYRTPREA